MLVDNRFSVFMVVVKAGRRHRGLDIADGLLALGDAALEVVDPLFVERRAPFVPFGPRTPGASVLLVGTWLRRRAVGLRWLCRASAGSVAAGPAAVRPWRGRPPGGRCSVVLIRAPASAEASGRRASSASGAPFAPGAVPVTTGGLVAAGTGDSCRHPCPRGVLVPLAPEELLVVPRIQKRVSCRRC